MVITAAQRQNKITNAKIVDNVGIVKYKILVMVNINEFKHPKYYKELRKRNKLDQAISKPEPTGHARVRPPGPGLKQTSFKHQASSHKQTRT